MLLGYTISDLLVNYSAECGKDILVYQEKGVLISNIIHSNKVSVPSILICEGPPFFYSYLQLYFNLENVDLKKFFTIIPKSENSYTDNLVSPSLLYYVDTNRK